MKKTESTAVKTEDTAKAGTMVVLKTVLEPDKKVEPDKAGKSTPKSETKSKVAKAEKAATPKSGAKPKAAKAEKSAPEPEPKPKAAKVEKSAPEPEPKPEAAKVEKSAPQPEPKVEATTAEKSAPEAETKPEAAKVEKSAPKLETKPEAITAEKDDPKSEAKSELAKAENPSPVPEIKPEPPAQAAKPESNAGEQAVSPPASGDAPSVPNPPAVKATPTSSVIDSPLKRMKQEFTERANVIKQEMRNIQNSFLVIGFQLHWIKSNNMYKVLNYKNIMDYAEKEFGIKKSTCCNFINIIENYAERDENGEVIESIVECYRNFSSSQLLAMIGMPEEIQQQVTPDMSVRAINRLRKGEPEQPPVDAPKAVITDAEPAASAQINDAPKSATPMSAQETPKSTASIPVHELPKPATPVSVQPPKSITPVPVHKPAEPANNPTTSSNAKSLASHKDPAPRTLLEIASYSGYRSAVDKIDKLVKEAFSAGRQMKIKLVCEEG